MKKIILVLIIVGFSSILYCQVLYKGVYFGQSKSEAKEMLPDTSFYLQLGDYVSDKLSGYYKKSILIGLSFDQRMKTALNLRNMFAGNKGKDATWNTILNAKETFIKNGYQVNYENPVLNPASGTILGATRGFNFILQKDSILIGIGYYCTVSSSVRSFSNSGDQFAIIIFKSSIMLSDADYKTMFSINRPKKEHSDIF